ncbi:alpha/beta hydrolase family protein [Caldiplasma sukawensis]
MNKIVSKEVCWEVRGIEIFGSLLYPDDNLYHPGIILIAGSGPTDRDWCSPLLSGKNGSGKLLAQKLAEEGFVTLRYDKMTSGPHLKENLSKFAGKLSMETHVEEIAGAMTSIISHANVLEERIYAVTNSEGGIHAVNYQLSKFSPKFKALVLIGISGRSVADVARSQLLSQIKSLKDPNEIMKDYDSAIDQFLKGKKMEIKNSLPENVKLMLYSLDNPYNLPFSRELWNYSLIKQLKKIKESVLIVIGKKDIQVNWKQDGKLLETALSHKGTVEFEYPENADHVLKHVEFNVENISAEIAASQYNSDKTQLDSEAVNIITEWLKTH